MKRIQLMMTLSLLIFAVPEVKAGIT